MRGVWGWVWVCLLVVSVALQARAQEAHQAHQAHQAQQEIFEPVRVCVRPPDVPKGVVLWSYWPGGNTIVRPLREGDTQKKYPRMTFVYDPYAPSKSTELLPLRYKDLHLTCDPKPPPPPPVEEEEKKPKQEKKDAPGPAASRPAAEAKAGKEEEKKAEVNEASPGPSRAQGREPERDVAWHQRPPEHGVTTNWPHAVLPERALVLQERSVLPKREPMAKTPSVLPTHALNDPCTWVLPIKTATRDGEGVRACRGRGEGKGTKEGVKKTAADKFAEQLAYAAGVLNLQLDEDLHRPDGKQFGIVGGRNPNGPNHPAAQAVASSVSIAALLLSPRAEKLYNKLMTAAAEKAPLPMGALADAEAKLVDELAQKLGQKLEMDAAKKFAAGEGEAFARASMASTLEKAGAIETYEVMRGFTNKLGGEYQAHHILEVRWAKMFKIKNTDKLPAVILTEAEHKQMTANLGIATRNVETPEELWKAYEDVYADHPAWLAAIRKYFVKGK